MPLDRCPRGENGRSGAGGRRQHADHQGERAPCRHSTDTLERQRGERGRQRETLRAATEAEIFVIVCFVLRFLPRPLSPSALHGRCSLSHRAAAPHLIPFPLSLLQGRPRRRWRFGKSKPRLRSIATALRLGPFALSLCIARAARAFAVQLRCGLYIASALTLAAPLWRRFPPRLVSASLALTLSLSSLSLSFSRAPPDLHHPEILPRGLWRGVCADGRPRLFHEAPRFARCASSSLPAPSDLDSFALPAASGLFS